MNAVDASGETALHVAARAGIEEVKRRLVVASPTYTVKVVDKDGIREIDLAA